MELFKMDLSTLPSVRFIGHISYSTPWMHFSRKINEYILYIIKSGELYIKEDGRYFSLKKNDCLLLEPNKQHEGYQAACCHYHFVHFKQPTLVKTDLSMQQLTQEVMESRKRSLSSEYFSENASEPTSWYLPKQYAVKNPGEIFDLLFAAEEEFYSRLEYYRSFTSWKAAELLLKLSREFITSSIVALQPQYTVTYVKVCHIVNYLDSNYSKKITSDDIASIFESNYDYLNRIFKKATGLTIFEYLNETRILRAKELIHTTQMKFSEIAYLVGIDDQYYFSKLFKKITGITPTQYFNTIYRDADEALTWPQRR